MVERGRRVRGVEPEGRRAAHTTVLGGPWGAVGAEWARDRDEGVYCRVEKYSHAGIPLGFLNQAVESELYLSSPAQLSHRYD